MLQRSELILVPVDERMLCKGSSMGGLALSIKLVISRTMCNGESTGTVVDNKSASPMAVTLLFLLF